MSKYSIIHDGSSVSIVMSDDTDWSLDNYTKAFVDIWIDESIDSPLDTIENAMKFAEIIVKLLEEIA